MSIYCEDIGFVPFPLNPADALQVTFDIETFLGADTIASVAYSAIDNNGRSATALVLDEAEHDNTTTVIKPYIKGGADGKTYTVECLVTTTGGDKKTFYVRFECRDKTINGG